MTVPLQPRLSLRTACNVKLTCRTVEREPVVQSCPQKFGHSQREVGDKRPKVCYALQYHKVGVAPALGRLHLRQAFSINSLTVMREDGHWMILLTQACSK